MPATFAPQFFLLIGIDLFLALSVASTLLEDHYPKALGYMFDLAAFIGFAQLWSGPQFLQSFSDNLQFYLCVGYAVIAAMCGTATNLYLAVLKRKRILSIVFAVLLTIPAWLIMLFFVSAYVNAVPMELPVLPQFSWEQIYLLFAVAAILLVVMLVYSLRPFGKKNKQKDQAPPTPEPPKPPE